MAKELHFRALSTTQHNVKSADSDDDHMSSVERSVLFSGILNKTLETFQMKH